jgi:hypothetical protein
MTWCCPPNEGAKVTDFGLIDARRMVLGSLIDEQMLLAASAIEWKKKMK